MGPIRRYNTKHLRNAALVGVCAGCLGSAAIAQNDVTSTTGTPPLSLRTDYFGYAARISSQGTFSDNINLGPSGTEDSEFIASTIISGGAILSAPRVTGVIAGDLDFSYLIGESDFNVNQNVGATSTFSVVEDLFYLDISGQSSRQLAGDNAAFARNINSARDQQVSVNSYSVSPYLFRRFANQSNAELRYRFSQLFVPDSTFFSALDGVANVERSTAHEIFAGYESGRLAQRFRFRLSATGVDTTEVTDDSATEFGFQQGSILAEGQFVVSDAFSLSGGIGYDEVDTESAAGVFFDDDDISGVNWRAGFIATPNQRSNIRLEYGERFGGDFVSASVFYELSRRLSFRAGADRTFQTRSQTLGVRNRAQGALALDFADRLREGQELSPSALISSANQFARAVQNRSSQTIGVAVTDSAFAAFSGNYDRTRITLTGFYDDTDLGFRDIESYGASLFVDRRLSRRLTGFAGVDWRHTDSSFDIGVCQALPTVFGFDPTDPDFDAVTSCADAAIASGPTDTVIGRIGARYQFYRNLSAFAEYSHAERFASNPLQEYSENSLTAGISLDF